MWIFMSQIVWMKQQNYEKYHQLHSGPQSKTGKGRLRDLSSYDGDLDVRFSSEMTHSAAATPFNMKTTRQRGHLSSDLVQSQKKLLILKLSRSKQDAFMLSCTASSGGTRPAAFSNQLSSPSKEIKTGVNMQRWPSTSTAVTYMRTQHRGGFWEQPYDPHWPVSSKPLLASISSLSRSSTWKIRYWAALVFFCWYSMLPPACPKKDREVVVFSFEMGWRFF